MTFIVVFASQKGGVTKSTLARALAVEAAKAGLSVKVADLDYRQRTVADWAADRLGDAKRVPVNVQVYRDAETAIADCAGLNLLIVDAPGRSSEDLYKLAKVANLLIQPSGASLDDMRPAIREFNDLVKKGVPKARLAMILGRVKSEAEIRDATAFIEEAGYRVLPGTLRDMPAYRAAMAMGASVTEVKAKKLREEAEKAVSALVDAILGDDARGEDAA